MKKVLQRVRKWYLERKMRERDLIQITYGTVIQKNFWRKWYNPLKYVLGEIGIKNIKPKEFLTRLNK